MTPVRAIQLTVRVIVVSLCVAAAIGASDLLLTAPGAKFLLELAIARGLGPTAASLGAVDGSLGRGLSIQGVTLRGVPQLPSGNTLTIERLNASLAFLGPKRSPIEMERVRLTVPGMVEAITAESVALSFLRVIAVRELRVQGVTGWPDGSDLEIQGVGLVGLPASAVGLRESTISLFNGRLRLPDSDPVAFSGDYRHGELDTHFYANRLSIRELFTLVSRSTDARRLAGAISDAHLRLSGSVTEPVLQGACTLDGLWRNGFSMAHCPVSFSVRLKDLANGVKCDGEIALRGGTVASKNTAVVLQHGRILFAGDPRAPAFDLRGTSTIGTTKISIALSGTLAQPKLRLSSQPPLAEEWLLLMLATGKSWQGAEPSASQGPISTELAQDFLDYFMFAGLGSKLAKQFGISDLSLTYNSETQGLGVTTTLVDTLSLSVEADRADTEESITSDQSHDWKPPMAYRVGARYQVTDSTSLEVEGERQPAMPRARVGDSSQPPGGLAAPQTQDQVLMKIKRRF